MRHGTVVAERCVRQCYATWPRTYYREYYGATASYPPVHVGIIKRLLKRAGARRVLDAGCGPASLLRELRSPRLDLYGFDLTPEMVAKAMARLARHFNRAEPPRRPGCQGAPGYDDILARTHNPLVFHHQMEAAGFQDVRLLFYHWHCLPPMYGALAPKLARRASLAMEQNPEDWRGHFMASAFMAVGRRR